MSLHSFLPRAASPTLGLAALTLLALAPAARAQTQDLFVSNGNNNTISRFAGTGPGAFSTTATMLSGGLNEPMALAFSPSTAPASTGINGFSDPGGFTLNANSGGPDNQSAAAHGVPAIGGGTLHLTTAQGMAEPGTFYGSENTSAYYNRRQYIGQFYASFVYHYNGTNPQSFGPGNGFTFILQNDPRGLTALGTSGFGNGPQGDGNTIMPSAAVEFNLFTGFGQNQGTQLAINGDQPYGSAAFQGFFPPSAPVNLTSGDPISVILSYDGTALSETLFDTVTRDTYSTRYATNLPAALGSSSAYVGFTGGTGAAVADQTITDFVFTNSVPVSPVNAGPKITITAAASAADSNGRRLITVTTTNTGGAAADMLTLTSVTLGGVPPAPVPPSASPVPTTPNNLSNLPGMNTQTNGFVFSPSPGTPKLPLNIAISYVDQNNIAHHLIAGIRLVLP